MHLRSLIVSLVALVEHIGGRLLAALCCACIFNSDNGGPSLVDPTILFMAGQPSVFTPPSDASRTIVMLVIGFVGAGLYLVFSMFRLQVPSELSAPKIPTAVIAIPTTRLVTMFVIVCSPRLEFWYLVDRSNNIP